MNLVLGGGLSGLAAGYTFANAGEPTTVVEKDSTVGGLAKTVHYGDYKFDLGGHRFLSDKTELNTLVARLLGDDLQTVPRTSQIYMGSKFYDYPLTPRNAIFGLGFKTTAKILSDYSKEKIFNCFRRRNIVSLEDWVIAQFGRTMFDLYFKEYSEKVWGIDCSEICMDWVAKRIDGLSLWQTIRHAISISKKTNVKTLTDNFLYPRFGIGQISDKLQEVISRNNSTLTDTSIEKVFCKDNKIQSVVFKNGQCEFTLQANHYISSIPLTVLLDKIHPSPPGFVLKAASKIRFRSLVVTTLMLNKDKMTDLTWMYLPGKEIPFGRIHEPKNWSREMAPKGKSHVVAEYFCNQADQTWKATDNDLVSTTTTHLHRLGFIDKEDVIDRCVLRIPHAYPVFNVGYKKHVKIIRDYLGQFSNLHLIGRSGLYSYLNMDHAMESGINMAKKVLNSGNVSRAPLTDAYNILPNRALQPNYSFPN